MAQAGQGKETELKFQLSDLPQNLGEGTQINQKYFDFKNNLELQGKANSLFGQDLNWNEYKELRIRQKGEKFYLTAKGEQNDSDASRAETEVELTDLSTIKDLQANYATLGEVDKVRFEVSLSNGLIAEVDQYKGKLEGAEGKTGLITVEVEFNPAEFTAEDVASLVKQEITPNAENVTEIKAFKNKNLALAKDFQEVSLKANEEAHLREAGLNKA